MKLYVCNTDFFDTEKPSYLMCHRLMLMDNVERTQLWNVFNQVTLHSHDARHHRFCLRLMLKHPDNHALYLLNGHTSLVSGTFKHALGICRYLVLVLFIDLSVHDWVTAGCLGACLHEGCHFSLEFDDLIIFYCIFFL